MNTPQPHDPMSDVDDLENAAAAFGRDGKNYEAVKDARRRVVATIANVAQQVKAPATKPAA